MEDKKKECYVCGAIFDIGFKMNDSCYVCATHRCCYEFCEIEGEKVYQFTDEDEEIEVE